MTSPARRGSRARVLVAIALLGVVLLSCVDEEAVAATDAALEALTSDLLARSDVLEAGANYDISTSVALPGVISVFVRGVSDDRDDLLALVSEVSEVVWDSQIPEISSLTVTVAPARGGSTVYDISEVFGQGTVNRADLEAEFGPRNGG